ncbi:MAG: hypothetical protein ACOH2A_10965 [Sphingobacteriaceae bacterium]
MNLKRTFGTLLTVIGIIGLIYGAYSFVQHTGESRTVIVSCIIGILFFFSGISLIRNTKDEA